MRFPTVVGLVVAALLVALFANAAPSGKGSSNKMAVGNPQESLNQFSIDFYKQITADASETTNAFFSPISIASALLLVYGGAKGDTANELASAVHLDQQNQEPAQLLDTFRKASIIFAPNPDLPYSLNLANRIFMDKSFKLKDSYKSLVQSKLNSSVGSLDFKNHAADARKDINQWVEKQTNGKIKNLATKDNTKEDTVMALVNAIYFKGKWSSVFDPRSTDKAPFKNLDGSTNQVPMMAEWAKHHGYHDNLDGSKNDLPPFHMVSKRYLSGPNDTDHVSMWVLLPKDVNGLPALEKALTGDKLGRAMKDAGRDRKINLQLPKFKLENLYDLKKSLNALGVQKMFNGGDLSGISDGPVKVSSAVHKTFVDVNEEGTEAAAATFMSLAGMSMAKELPPVEFFIDHPFMFAIRHDGSGTILFLGRVAKL
ncbi:hypothetical protein RvY_19478 [Ramazzottius varieornatus]|uniref:Serpin domain-containing protein n=1 Tax=Ramazzottius varieornatus TaxID=947166 RepID=A0A1D1WAA6_RAMVA|nr:hypothetical protein RvY_19457 [Ramazzottius varieornatus]GAV09993.1 hypothetical protein RvY_19478 [Ramazzottius varieornatus]